jgi:hypothetical protein
VEHIKAVGTLNDTKADLAFVGGKIQTPAHPSGFVQALAVRGGVIQALGTDADIKDLTGPRTRVVDLRGRLALPAFGDAHVHPVGGGLESLRCNLLGLRTRHEYLDVIAAYSTTLPADAWVLGGGWTMAAFPGGTPVAADLDAVTGGRPAFLPNRDHHSAWVNAAALAIAGVDARTPDPQDGWIERDEAGQPAGALHDGAMRLVAAHVPPVSGAELTAGLLAAQAYLHSLGITRWQDACVGAAGELGIPDAFDVYCQAAADGLLTGHTVGALWWDRSRGLEQIDDLLARRERAAAGDGRFRATTVKLMVDGVCETFTAAMSAPYLDRHGHPSGRSGNLFIEPAVLSEATRLLAAAGFQLHFRHDGGERKGGIRRRVTPPRKPAGHEPIRSFVDRPAKELECGNDWLRFRRWQVAPRFFSRPAARRRLLLPCRPRHRVRRPAVRRQHLLRRSRPRPVTSTPARSSPAPRRPAPSARPSPRERLARRPSKEAWPASSTGHPLPLRETRMCPRPIRCAWW